MSVDRRVAERLLDVIVRYNSNVSRMIQDKPEKREEILRKLQYGLKSVAYGIPADAGDALFEKLEDAVTAGSGPAAPGVEIAGAIIERILLSPLEKLYHGSLEEYHPILSEGLKIYQLATEIPILDSILSMIPEKTISAIGVFVHDIYRIMKDAKDYVRSGDYVKELYGKKDVGPYYDDSPHPLRPVDVYT
ncbi:MAG: hypothetical protein GF368_03305 [Candidatus Aenigmarchaeota archaeon]|nr:hypothetical protein [Candidatus Aenigmarchaeota archaeon]